jgi:site-specific DNA-methyltransferase (adenine-specific)/modification methylase
MIKTLCGDMLEVSNEISDGSIDLLLTDPPYNISQDGANPEWIDPKTGENKNTIHSQRFSDSFEQDWDNVGHEEFIKQMESWAAVWFKKLRKGGSFAVFISDQYVSYLWKIMEAAGFEPKRVWVWKKPAAVPFNRKVMPVSGCEYILWGIKPKGKRTFNSDTPRYSIVDRYATADKVSSIMYKHFKENFGNMSVDKIFEQAIVEAKRVMDAQRIANDLVEAVVPNTITYSGGLGKDKIHPTQKPTEILEYFISLLSNSGDTVLDTFAGSGSTGIAAQNLNRNAILIERDSIMFKKMSERFTKDTHPLFEEG